MKNLKIFLTLVLCFSISSVLTPGLFASFESVGIGPRAIGLSNACTAISDDVYSIYYNPAGLSNLKRAEFASYYGSLYAGLSDQSNLNQLFLGYAQPIGSLGNFGLGYYSFNLTYWYRESILALSYSKNISLNFISGLSGRLGWFSDKKMNAGVTLKNLSKTYSDPENWISNAVGSDGIRTGQSDPVFGNGYGKSSLTADVGVQMNPAAGYTAGLAILNLIEPDMGLESSDYVTRELKIGGARSLGDGSISVDFSSKRFIEPDNRISIGAEKYFMNGIGIRGGLTIGLSREFRQFAFGFSYKIESMQFDYGLLIPLNGVGDTFGNHRVGLTFKFGKIYEAGDGGVRLQREVEARMKAENDAKEARKEVGEALRTKKQLEESLRESEQARLSTEKILRETETKLQEEGRTASAKAREAGDGGSVATKYADSLSYYNRKVREGVDLAQRTAILDRILSTYKTSGIDLTAVEQELLAVNNQYKQNSKDYRTSMDYYKRIISKNASSQEKRELLESIKLKYEKAGINMSELDSELSKLRGK